ncbi:transposase [Streptococcus pseudopneumoniae G42]|nr:transposase [Streptococcus pseudopneumoniae G42]
MGSSQKASQKGITKLQYLLRGSFVLFLFQLTIFIRKKDEKT